MIQTHKHATLTRRAAFYRNRRGRTYSAHAFAIRSILREWITELKVRWSYRTGLASDSAGNDLIRERIAAGLPCAIGKIGATECAVVAHYLKHPGEPFTPELRLWLYTGPGVFPVHQTAARRFCDTYLEALHSIDILAVWGNRGEPRIVARHCPKASLVPFESLEPYFFDVPWTSALAGKTVLIIHPFVKTLERQLGRNRSRIWRNPLMLPEFEAKLLAMPLQPILRQSPFPSWFALLDSLKEKIAASDFDVALIGAGGASLPLAAFIKSLGKVAIHTGGVTQMLFGVRGRRWENYDSFDHLYNEFWTRPHAGETPQNIDLIDDGCYW